MKKDAIHFEETRLQDVETIQEYTDFHERHRAFPAVFEGRTHQKILDVAAGVGCAAQRIHQLYPAEILCNDITPKCLQILEKSGLPTVSFDLDNEQPYPFPDGSFDAVISLSTIEHLVHVDHFVKEAHRILKDSGYLYISSPNYASLAYFKRFVLAGRTFHDPISEDNRQRYEFYAHLRYFTYRTLMDFVSSFGFVPETVYLPLPEGSTRYRSLYKRSRVKALALRNAMKLLYKVGSPRWASEPVICFQKTQENQGKKIKKVLI